MATFLDIGLLYNARIIFVVVFIFALIYGVLSKTKALGENKTIYIWIAVTVSLLFAFSANAAKFLDVVIPPFVIFIIMVFIMLTVFIFMGGKADAFHTIFSAYNPSMMGYWILIISLLILAGGLGKVYFDPSTSSTDTITVESNSTGDSAIQVADGDNIGTQGEAALWDTIFHPQVLGFILIMLIATFSVMFLSKA
ncbi:hypothetical protein JXM83_07515 [Candidatus Woesearchaeota archaeon]|nr:hypothetical protein [Candidatus Woesearchaeota archaeon]